MSNWIKFVKKYALDNNLSYKNAMCDPKCKNSYKLLQGGGIVDLFKNSTKTIDALINGISDYSPKVRDILHKYGNETIISAIIIRNPIQSAMINVLNAISLGSFKKKLDRSEYDKIFHLQLFIKTSSNTTISIEKNEVINMNINPSMPKNAESSIIHQLHQGMTLQTLMNNTQSYMKKSFFYYSAKDCNCQDFIMGILNANNIGDESNRNFTKQNTDQLFADSEYLRKISNTVTDIGAKANIIQNGAGFKY